MARLAGARDHAVDRRLRHYVFEEKLRPALAVEFGGPCRQCPTFDFGEQLALCERPVDDYRGPAIGCGRQQTSLGLALGERIVELHEIIVARRQKLFEFTISAFMIMRDT